MNQAERKQILVTNIPSPQFVEALMRGLVEAGFWAFQSFDLQSTRALHEGCTCPHHGTDHCTCHMSVLLVYHTEGDPVTMILDGRDQQTFVSLTQEAGRDLPPNVEQGIAAVVEQTAARLAIPAAPTDS